MKDGRVLVMVFYHEDQFGFITKNIQNDVKKKKTYKMKMMIYTYYIDIFFEQI